PSSFTLFMLTFQSELQLRSPVQFGGLSFRATSSAQTSRAIGPPRYRSGSNYPLRRRVPQRISQWIEIHKDEKRASLARVAAPCLHRSVTFGACHGYAR